MTEMERFTVGDMVLLIELLVICHSSGRQGAILAALIRCINIIKVLLLVLGMWKDDATVKSMSRFGDHSEPLKGPLYYATTITLASAIYWRTFLIAIAAVWNLCAGDGCTKALEIGDQLQPGCSADAFFDELTRRHPNIFQMLTVPTFSEHPMKSTREAKVSGWLGIC